MSLYERWIFPRILDLSMRSQEVTRYRKQLVPQAKGQVLEIGMGSGLNLPFYGPDVERLYGLEPSAELRTMASRRVQKAGVGLTLLDCSAEQIRLGDRSMDTVVMTWTLCTIPDAARALAEVHRVLKPGGDLLFAEHGLARDAGVRVWQHRLTPLWTRIAGGCHLNRKIDDLISGAAFRLEELRTEYAKGPRPMTFMYVGRARRGDGL
jgi:ubiquinone/menaquinone biosynthesis C-methylase UbiE